MPEIVEVKLVHLLDGLPGGPMLFGDAVGGDGSGADFWEPAGADCARSGETRAAMGRTSAARTRRRKIYRRTGPLLLFHFTTAARGRRRYDACAARKKSAETLPLVVDMAR